MLSPTCRCTCVLPGQSRLIPALTGFIFCAITAAACGGGPAAPETSNTAPHDAGQPGNEVVVVEGFENGGTDGENPAGDACATGTVFCDGKLVKFCQNDGTANVIALCETGEACQDGSCVGPGQFLCQANFDCQKAGFAGYRCVNFACEPGPAEGTEGLPAEGPEGSGGGLDGDAQGGVEGPEGPEGFDDPEGPEGTGPEGPEGDPNIEGQEGVEGGPPDAGPGPECTSDFACLTPTPLCRAGKCVSCLQTVCDSGTTCDATTGGCVAQLRPCQTNVDCPDPGQVCGLRDDMVNEGKFIAVCVPKVGPGIGGAPCKTAGDCATGACFTTATCYGPCQTDADCAPGNRCGQAALANDMGTPSDPSDDITTQVSACVPAPTMCARDADCPNGKVCAYYVQAGSADFTGQCTNKAGAVASGGACTSDSHCATNQCNCDTQSCSGAHDGICFGACQSDSDCTPGSKCLYQIHLVDPNQTPGKVTDDTFVPVRQCSIATACTVDSDCGSRVCKPQNDPNDSKKLVLRCDVHGGAKRGGASCTQNAECFSAVCLSNNICYGACKTDANCVAPGSKCGQVAFTDPVRAITYNTVPACLPPQ